MMLSRIIMTESGLEGDSGLNQLCSDAMLEMQLTRNALEQHLGS